MKLLALVAMAFVLACGQPRDGWGFDWLFGNKPNMPNKPNKPTSIFGGNKPGGDHANPNHCDHWVNGLLSWLGGWVNICEDDSDFETIVATANATESLSTLVAVLSDPRYKPVLDVLSGDGPFTVFAPTNQAFADANVDLDDVEGVTKVLKYHVVSGEYTTWYLPWKGQLKTVLGELLEIVNWWGDITVNGADIVTRNVRASNGVVHIIDAVLIPDASRPTIVQHASSTPELTTLVSILTDTRYEPVLEILTRNVDAKRTGGKWGLGYSGEGMVTVFAPTNTAFEAAGLDVNDVEKVTEVLKYHLVDGYYPTDNLGWTRKLKTLQGEKVRISRDYTSQKRDKTWQVNSAELLITDVLASNGVVHVIDEVLLPRSDRPSIVTLASNTPALSTLVSVLTDARYKPVLDALSSEGPFTVFAPTNDAFAAAILDLDDVDSVTDTLKYHVIKGRHLPSKLHWNSALETLKGSYVSVTRDFRDDTVTVNGVEATAVHVDLSNGFVYTIPSVLSPGQCLHRGRSVKHGTWVWGSHGYCKCEDGVLVNCEPERPNPDGSGDDTTTTAAPIERPTLSPDQSEKIDPK